MIALATMKMVGNEKIQNCTIISKALHAKWMQIRQKCSNIFTVEHIKRLRHFCIKK